MMWNRYGLPIAVIGIGLTASLVSYEVANAVRSRDYTPREFRAVLRGFGYNVPEGNSLRDQETRAAVRQFQQGYKLAVDGVAGPNTQNLAADLVRIVKSNLNLVLKPSPGLPVTQFYDSQTEAAVRRFQEQFNLPVTGIANLAVRQRLDQEARQILGKPTPAASPSPSPSPTTSPSPSPSPTTPTQRTVPQTTTPSPSPSGSPGAAPSGAPGTAPSGAPGAAPSGAPGTAPSGAPGTAPSGAPGTAPSGAPGTAPSGAPGTAPSPATSPSPSPSPRTNPTGGAR